MAFVYRHTAEKERRLRAAALGLRLRSFRRRSLGAFAGQEVFHGRGQVRDAGLQFLEVVGQRPLVAAATVTVVVVV